jgi:ABC-type sugar transport system ATPase subunit
VARVVLENLDCRYGDTHAVKSINLTIEDGELCVLLGPSGCGKTSTLRMVAGFVKPSGGEIYIDDEPISHLYPGHRNIAMVFQNYALYPHKTVRQHFAFPLQATKMPRAEIKQRVQEMAEFLHMEDLLDRYPLALSAGQQQRVAIGRALIRRPRVFLLDEPLSNLDARLRVEMRTNLRRLQQDLGITTIYVTHDQVEAQAVADKIVVMELGNIRQAGTSEEIYRRPADLFVAGFIGSPPMNFFDCHFARRNGTATLVSEQFQIALEDRISRQMQPMDERHPLVLGVRPEHIKLSSEGQPNSVPAGVVVVEPQSNEWIVDLEMGDQLVKMRGDKREIRVRPAIGQRMWLQFQQPHMHLFDRESGEALLA